MILYHPTSRALARGILRSGFTDANRVPFITGVSIRLYRDPTGRSDIPLETNQLMAIDGKPFGPDVIDYPSQADPAIWEEMERHLHGSAPADPVVLEVTLPDDVPLRGHTLVEPIKVRHKTTGEIRSTNAAVWAGEYWLPLPLLSDARVRLVPRHLTEKEETELLAALTRLRAAFESAKLEPEEISRRLGRIEDAVRSPDLE